MFNDTDFLLSLHQNIIRPDSHTWKTPGIKSILQFAWGIFLRVLSQFQKLDCYEEIFEEDEEVLNVAIDADAIKLLRTCVVSADTFLQEVTLFIGFVLMLLEFIRCYPPHSLQILKQGAHKIILP